MKFKNTETFGQFPLQVSGLNDVHECLEAEMAEGLIEVATGSSEDAAEKSDQEVSHISNERGRKPRTC